jgi:hypothetical protein
MTTTVRDAPERSRYEILVDGELVGIADYEDAGETRVFPHTFVEPAWRGRGLAEELVRSALDDVRASGRRIVPACWYVAQFVDRHPAYADLLTT